jgi:peptidyl-prolyl cis-trans isomerase A (cyclophilin A)
LVAKYLIVCFALLAGTEVAQGTAPAALVNVVVHTALGDIQLALDEAHAPVTVANFLHYVDTRRFDNITFYRVVRVGDEGKYGLVQGGLQGNPKLAFKPIAHESPAATGLSHLDGAISMARTEPGTARADFFFIVGDLVSLDGKPPEDAGYAVFGRVTAGMDLVRQMLNLPRDPNAGADAGMKDQMLLRPVKIYSVRRAD